jgi:hypothetical protein
MIHVHVAVEESIRSVVLTNNKLVDKLQMKNLLIQSMIIRIRKINSHSRKRSKKLKLLVEKR